MEQVTVDNFEAQHEEIEALCAIYGDEFTLQKERLQGVHPCTEICVSVRSESLDAQLTCHLPDTYPLEDAPVAEISSATLGRAAICELGSAMHAENPYMPGEVIIFTWAEWLRSKLEQWEDERKANIGNLAKETEELVEGTRGKQCPTAQDNANSDIPVEEQNNDETFTQTSTTAYELEARGIQVVHGSPFTDRKSTFQAHLAHISSEEEAQLVLAHLLEDRKIARATHNIMAYRVYDDEKEIQYKDNDDDGETAAASKMAEMMHLMDCNNVIVVVSRWYGGIHLGPDRFRHINNCAREILEEHGFNNRDNRKGGSGSGSSKKKAVSSSARGKKKKS